MVKPQPVCPTPQPVPVTFSAPVYEMFGPLLRATGGVIFVRGNQHISAQDVEYNFDTERGRMSRVYFTTCRSAHPDYHITARDITLLPNNRLHARSVALYIGRYKVLALPSMNLRVGGRAATHAIFPRPGYDKLDGATLSQTLRLTDTVQWRTTADLRLTTKHSIQGELDSIYGVDGNLVDLPGRYLTYGSFRSRALNIPLPPAGDCDPQLLRPTNAARLRPFGRFTLRQRTYDARNLGLVVYRQPELGATYTGEQLSLTRQKLDPRLEIYPQVTASWGRFKEIPGHPDYINRDMISAQAGLNALWLGPSTTIQPLGIATFAKYGNGDTFETWGYGIDISHLTPNGSYLSGRYISRTSSGKTPFEFDDIDIRNEIDGAFQTYFGRHIIGMAMSYNADIGSIFDWQILYGYRTDCTASWIRWDQRLQRISFDVTLINL